MMSNSNMSKEMFIMSINSLSAYGNLMGLKDDYYLIPFIIRYCKIGSNLVSEFLIQIYKKDCI